MPLRKTAIAIPADLLSAVDRAAQARHETRDQFITRVLREAVRTRRDAEALVGRGQAETPAGDQLSPVQDVGVNRTVD